MSASSDISGDERYVAFVSSSSNLVTADTNGVQDGFVRDRKDGTMVRVSGLNRSRRRATREGSG